MARITVEDCLRRIPNRFELVMVAAKRARQLEMEGETSLVERENDKSTVLSLREIAAGHIGVKILEKTSNRKPAIKNLDIETETDIKSAGEIGAVV